MSSELGLAEGLCFPPFGTTNAQTCGTSTPPQEHMKVLRDDCIMGITLPVGVAREARRTGTYREDRGRGRRDGECRVDDVVLPAPVRPSLWPCGTLDDTHRIIVQECWDNGSISCRRALLGPGYGTARCAITRDDAPCGDWGASGVTCDWASRAAAGTQGSVAGKRTRGDCSAYEHAWGGCDTRA